jgi:hypothetical protein
MITAFSYRIPAFEIVSLIQAMLLASAVVIAVVFTVMAVQAAMPLLLMALPVLGKFVGGLALVYVFAKATMPR